MTTASAPRILILGALSAIAEAAAREWARQGARLLLVARDAARLDSVAADLRAHGGAVETAAMDLADGAIEQALDGLAARLGGIDIVLVAYGILGEQTAAERDAAQAQRILAVNFTSAARWCLAVANLLESQGHGTLLVIGSVAGDRGRASNYIYGAAKGGLGVLVEGIAHRLARGGAARAVLIKPGFVDTPMTASIADKGPLWARPERIAQVIVKASAGTRPVVYAPWFWRWVMVVIRLLPA